MKLHFVEFIKYTNRYQWYNGTGSFICLYITWKNWNFIHKFPPMEILLNIWWKSLHRNSRYCQNHQNGVTSCFPKVVINMKKKIFVVNHQNIGFKEEKDWNFETWPFTKRDWAFWNTVICIECKKFLSDSVHLMKLTYLTSTT